MRSDMVKAVFIDIDNTLLSFDGYVKEALENGFRTFGLRAYEPWMYDVFTRINLSYWAQIERGELTFEELEKVRFRAVFQELSIDFDGPSFEKYFRKCLDDSAILMDGAKELLEYLQGKYILCTASNGPYYQQTNRLKRGGLLSFFDYHFISEEMGVSKPSKEFFSLAFERLGGISPSECMMIGDSLTSDMSGGGNAGMKTCWYNQEGKDLPEGLHVDHVVQNLKDIKDYL